MKHRRQRRERRSRRWRMNGVTFGGRIDAQQKHLHPQHECTKSGEHLHHRCSCSANKRNPSLAPILTQPPLDLRMQLAVQMNKWLRECHPSFQWKNEDVLDFAELSFPRVRLAFGESQHEHTDVTNDYYDEEEYYDEEDSFVMCPNCRGSGLEWEGWPCEYCGGLGHLDF